MDSAKRSVLVVDDEPTVRRLVKRILGQRYTVIEAEDGIRAVEAAKADLPDLILMDMMMPSMDGLSACYAIRQEASTTRIPVVMLTAITHDLNRRLSETVMGANGYITKPFQPAELLSIVETLLSTRAAPVDCAACAIEPAAPARSPNG